MPIDESSSPHHASLVLIDGYCGSTSFEMREHVNTTTRDPSVVCIWAVHGTQLCALALSSA